MDPKPRAGEPEAEPGRGEPDQAIRTMIIRLDIKLRKLTGVLHAARTEVEECTAALQMQAAAGRPPRGGDLLKDRADQLKDLQLQFYEVLNGLLRCTTTVARMTPEQPLSAQASAPPAAQASAPPAAKAAAPPAAQAAMQTHGGDVLLAKLEVLGREDSRLAPPPGWPGTLEPSELLLSEKRLSNEVAALEREKKEADTDLIHASDSLKHAQHFYESTKRACIEVSRSYAYRNTQLHIIQERIAENSSKKARRDAGPSSRTTSG